MVKGYVIFITYRNGSSLTISVGGDPFLLWGKEMKEKYNFFGIRKNPDPDHIPKVKHAQIMSKSDAELLEWICTTGYEEALKELEEENGKQ